MSDNKTSQAAQDYDGNVEKTIPRYRIFHDETLDLVRLVHLKPCKWLDTGCGTGSLVFKALEIFNSTHFVMADPAEAMLAIAKEKFREYPQEIMQYACLGTEHLNFAPGSFEVVTAILAHHYLDSTLRKNATANCYRMLVKGGIYVTFETIKPNSKKTTQIGLERWRLAQLRQGKSLEAVDKHISRYGVELSPISIEAHVRLLQDVGFAEVEILWVSGMQAGFYAIK